MDPIPIGQATPQGRSQPTQAERSQDQTDIRSTAQVADRQWEHHG